MQNLHYSAINSALSHDWHKAVILNEGILESDKDNLDALSRLAYAFTKLGKILKAKKLYQKILELDPYSLIAQKNLDRLKQLPKYKISPASEFLSAPSISPRIFIEEPGKTKAINLTNLAPYDILIRQHIGDTVYLYPKKHDIEVRTNNKTYIGALPDDISYRLIKFIKEGNVYHVCIKNIQKKCVSIFLREIKRGKKMLNQPTFLPLRENPISIKAVKEPVSDMDIQEEDESDE